MNTSMTDTADAQTYTSRHYNLLRIMILAIALALVAGTLGGCSSPDDKNVYDTGSNGQTIKIEKGDMFRLRMLVNVQTGAKWQIVELDRTILDQQGEPKAMGNIVIGGLARIYSYNFVFKAMRPGTTELKLQLLKPDQKEPLETYSATIVVQ
jgi:hypothetical protein